MEEDLRIPVAYKGSIAEGCIYCNPENYARIGNSTDHDNPICTGNHRGGVTVRVKKNADYG